MTLLWWLAWHTGRGHLVTPRRPWDMPVGWVLACRCGGMRGPY